MLHEKTIISHIGHYVLAIVVGSFLVRKYMKHELPELEAVSKPPQ